MFKSRVCEVLIQDSIHLGVSVIHLGLKAHLDLGHWETFESKDVVTNLMPFCSTFVINYHTLQGQINYPSLVLYSCIITPSFKFPDSS